MGTIGPVQQSMMGGICAVFLHITISVTILVTIYITISITISITINISISVTISVTIAVTVSATHAGISIIHLTQSLRSQMSSFFSSNNQLISSPYSSSRRASGV